MEYKNTPEFQSIDAALLEPVARRASGRAEMRIRDWQVSQMGGGAGNPVSVGLYRFSGSGQDGGESVPWSVVLKVIQSPAKAGWVDMGEGKDPGHWNYWKRESAVYQSDFLAHLPDGLSAPHCFGVRELPGETAWLWLEEMSDDLGGDWLLERYSLTARHLGRFNGQFSAADKLPDYPWLGRNLTHQWASAPPPQWQALNWEDPRVLARYPRGNAFQRLIAGWEQIEAGLAAVPETICHGDTYPSNFMSRRMSDGQDETIALDWALLNRARLGDDLGQFAFGAVINLPHLRPEQVIHCLFENYLDGLRDSGCRTDGRLVRFGFAAAAAVRVGLFQVILLAEELRQASLPAEPPDPVSTCFEIQMAEQVFALLDEM